MLQFDKLQGFGKDGFEAAIKSLSAMTNGMQTAAVETADYAKRSFEHGSQTAERLLGARAVDTAMQIQTDYARSAYEGFVAQATRMGEIAADTAKAAYAPIESLVSRPVAA